MDFTNYLTLRSSNLASVKATNMSLSTLTGSTLIVTTNVTAPAITASTIIVSTINGALPGTGSGSTSTMISFGASTTQSNNFSGGSYTTGWGSTLTGLTAITDVAMTQSGQYQLAVQNGSSTIRTSANSGVTWGTLTGANGLPAGATAYPQATAAGTPNYASLSVSATGQYQLASVSGGLLYVCANGLSATPTFTAVGMGAPNIYLPFENSVADVVGSSNPVATGSPGYVSGLVGSYAINLANTAGGTATKYVRATWSLPSNFTISFWVNQQSSSASQPQMIFASAGGTVAILFNTSNQLYANFPTGGGTSYTTITTSFVLSLNTWYHVYYLFQTGGTCALYVNGTLIGSFTNSSGVGTLTTTAFGLGTYEITSNNVAFNGYIDDFRIYNSAITYNPIVPMNWTQTAVSPTGQYMLAAGSGGVFQSSNYGVTWTQLTNTQIATLLNPGQAPYTIGGPTLQPNSASATSATWTANGVTWIASSSTNNNSANFAAWVAFNNTAPTGSPAQPYSWASNAVYNASGVYTGAVSTTILGGVGTVLGEWIQLQSSAPLVMTSYSYGCGAATGIPKVYYIVGSNDATNWYPIQTATMTTNPLTANFTACTSYLIVNQSGTQTIAGGTTGSGTFTTYPTTTMSYTYFRLITNSTFNALNAEYTELFINFANPVPLFVSPTLSNVSLMTVTPQLTGLATNTWTTNGVTWISSESSVYSAGYETFRALDGNYGNRWVPSYGYSTAGNSSGIYTTVQGGIGSIQGDWMQLRSSVPLVMTSYQFANGNTYGISRLPKTFYLIGSNDGTTWYPIQYASAAASPSNTTNVLIANVIIVNNASAQAFGSSTLTTTTYATTTTAYTYFRLVCLSSYNAGNDNIDVGEWIIYFTAATPNPVNTLAISNANMMVGAVGATAPNTLGITASSTALTTSPWTINGVTWTASTSSVFTSTTAVSNAFNHSATLEWVPLSSTYTTAGNSSGITTIIQGITPAVTGEWIQIQSSVPLVMASYQFATGNVVARTPKTYYIVGSNDGSTWYPIQYGAGGAVTTTASYTPVPGILLVNSTSTQTFGSSTIATTAYSTSTSAYRYFRLICLSNYSATNDVVSLGEWYINFQDNLTSSSVNNGLTWTTTLTAPVLATTGTYVLAGTNQTAYVYSNGITGSYTIPALTGINASIVTAALSTTGQYMVIITAGTTNNVFYSTNYGSTWTALTVGSAALTSCAMSADGSYITVANATTVYTLNRNTQGFSVAIGNQAGAVNQGLNAIAIGNQAGLVNQSASSIVLNASGATFDAYLPGLFVAPITTYTNSSAPSFSLLGYGSDSQVVQTGLTVLQNGSVTVDNAIVSQHGYVSAQGMYTNTTASQQTYYFQIGLLQGWSEHWLSCEANSFVGATKIQWNASTWNGTSNGGVPVTVTNNSSTSFSNPVRAVYVINTTGASQNSTSQVWIQVVLNSTTYVRHSYQSGGIFDHGANNGVLITSTSVPLTSFPPTGYTTQQTYTLSSSSGVSAYVLMGQNVGIGTATPGYPLHVVGSINLTGSILYNGVAITTGAGSIWTAGAGGVAYYSGGNVGIGTATPGYRFVVDNGSVTGINAFIQASSMASSTSTSILLGKALSGNNCGTFLWNHVADGSASNYVGIGYYGGDNKLTVTCGGNVGIGITNPGTTLDVVGTIQGQTAFQSNANATVVGLASLQTVYLGQYGAAAARGTNVRIGDILGAAYYISTGGYNLTFYKDVSGGNAVSALQIMGTSATNVTPNIYIPNSLGIGITNPTASMHVTGTTIFSDIDIHKQANVSVRRSTDTSFAIVAGGENYKSILYLGTPFYSGTTAGAYKCAIMAVGSGSGWGWSTNDLHFCINNSTGQTPTDTNTSAFTATVADSRMVIKTSGYVGINTTGPLARLTIRNLYSDGDTGGLCLDSADGNVYNMRLSSFTPAASQVSYRFGVNNLTSSSPNTLVLAYNGNVGIGTSAPGYLLDVSGITRSAGVINTSPAYYIGYTSSNPTIYKSDGTNNTSGTIYSSVYNYVAFPTNSQTPAGFITATGGKYTVAYSGIYAITFTTGTAASNNAQLETFIAKNQYNNATDLNQPGTGTLASSYHPASTAQWCFSWTGYLSTSDFFTVGFFTSATAGTLGSRTTLSVALLNRTG